jgi:hypothetical protein
MKRAQMIGQVFIFILAGLVFVLILTYGYRAISGFIEKGEQVELLDFRNELDSAIAVIKRDYGSVQRLDLRVPSGTDEVCFVTSREEGIAPPWEESLQREHPLLHGSWATGAENVFLIPRQPTPMLIPDIQVEQGYCCVATVKSRIALRVEGTGNRAKVSPWPPAVCL